ncbi:MAG: SGNH/GDSL hydrolase family protein [Terracidiphilus sp.]|jgi:hypothetical protein
MWLNYKHDEVDRDRGYVQRLHLNSARVFMSYNAWLKDRVAYGQHLVDFVRTAHAHGTGTMIVMVDLPFMMMPDLFEESAKPKLRAWAENLYKDVAKKPGLEFWDVANEPDRRRSARARGISLPASPIPALLARTTQDFSGSLPVHPTPMPCSKTPAESECPRLWRPSRYCPRIQHNEGSGKHMISWLTHGLSVRCLRFTSRVTAAHARLASGWLAHLCREGVEPSEPIRKVSVSTSHPPF